MGYVTYNSKRLQPAPLVNITKNYNRTANGEIIGALYTLVVNGTIVAHKGSPNSSKVFHTTSGYPADESIASEARLSAILRKQEAIRELFSEEGHQFEIQGDDGAQPMKCNPRIIGPIEFSQGIWHDTCNYTITLEADKLYPMEEDEFTSLIADAQESWQIDTDETAETLGFPRTYRMTHTINAVGKRFYDDTGVLVQPAWKNAREFVIPRLGFDSSFLTSSGLKDLPSYYGGFNHVRTENIDEQGGAYIITETWILSSGAALEDFTVESNSTIENSLTTVTVQGNITGLELRNSNMDLSSTKYSNAESRFTIVSGLALTRAQTYSGHTLNVTPISQTVGRNPITGTINYSFGYDTRPSTLITGALSESVTIIDNLDTNAIAIVPILGRAAGPLLQSLSTKQAPLSRELSVEAVFPRATFSGTGIAQLQSAFFTQRPSAVVSGLIDAANPTNQGYSQVYIQTNTENWNPVNGRYTRQVSWIYEL